MTVDDKAIAAIVWLWRLAKGWLPQFLGLAATVFSIIWGSYGAEVWGKGIWAFWTTLGLLLAAAVAQVFLQRPTYMALAKMQRDAEKTSQAKSAALEKALEVLLRKIADHCTAAENSDRVSVYFFHQDRFIMLARYSRHPEYRRPGRTEYPAGQGAIGNAWDLGSVAMLLPDTRVRWQQRLVSKHGYSQKEAAELTMHCTSIAALRIEVDHQAVGVIVFESTEPTRIDQETIDTAQSSMLFAALCELVGVAAMFTPRGEEVGALPSKQPRAQPKWKSADS